MKKRAKKGEVIYREVQQMRQPWLWVILLGTAALMWYAAAKQLVFHIPYGGKEMSDSNLLTFWVIFGVGLPLVTFFGKLITEVREDALYLSFFPVQPFPRRVPYSDLKGCNPVIQRSPLSLGFLKRRGSKPRKAPEPNAVELVFHKGQPMIIGCDCPRELCRAIQARIRRARYPARSNKQES